MAWESRGDNRYYYRKRWEGGRCVSEYLGSSTTAMLLAEGDEGRRQEEAQAQAEERRRRSPAETTRQIVRGIAQELRTVTAAVLVANSYHQYKRQWRRRMDGTRLAYGEMSPLPAALAPPDPEQIKRGMHALNQALTVVPEATKKGKAADMANALAEIERRKAVRQVLDEYPCIWPHLNILLSNGLDALMEATSCNKDSTTGQIMLHHMKSMRKSLGYADSPMLEQLLIEQVLLTWFDLDAMQRYYAAYAIQNHTLTAGAYWDRRLNSAQQRYLRAVETLARVRRLSSATPLQVNIGGQQVNVAGGAWDGVYRNAAPKPPPPGK
jgi:hypothetical protein